MTEIETILERECSYCKIKKTRKRFLLTEWEKPNERKCRVCVKKEKELTVEQIRLETQEEKKKQRIKTADVNFRAEIFSRDNHKCYFCKERADTIDHLTPISKGGETTVKNCRAACGNCNRMKGDMLEDEFLDCISLIHSIKDKSKKKKQKKKQKNQKVTFSITFTEI